MTRRTTVAVEEIKRKAGVGEAQDGLLYDIAALTFRDDATALVEMNDGSREEADIGQTAAMLFSLIVNDAFASGRANPGRYVVRLDRKLDGTTELKLVEARGE